MGTLLTTREAAERLSVPISTFLRWVAENRVPVAQKLSGVRGAYLYSAADLDALEIGQRIAAPPVIEATA